MNDLREFIHALRGPAGVPPPKVHVDFSYLPTAVAWTYLSYQQLIW